MATERTPPMDPGPCTRVPWRLSHGTIQMPVASLRSAGSPTNDARRNRRVLEIAVDEQMPALAVGRLTSRSTTNLDRTNPSLHAGQCASMHLAARGRLDTDIQATLDLAPPACTSREPSAPLAPILTFAVPVRANNHTSSRCRKLRAETWEPMPRQITSCQVPARGVPVHHVPTPVGAGNNRALTTPTISLFRSHKEPRADRTVVTTRALRSQELHPSTIARNLPFYHRLHKPIVAAGSSQRVQQAGRSSQREASVSLCSPRQPPHEDR